MNYTQALEYIHSLDRFGSRPGLDRVQKLFDKIPGVLDQRFLHIAGTNGKGSVSMMLSSILQEAGYRVGLFISPYIVDFRERIQINQQMIGRQELADAVAYLKPFMDELREDGVIITEFEFLTAVGFCLFRQQRCDIVVCEVGMGGLLDSTNLIPSPLCSVITRIALDHTEILGDTLAAIATQKCGIIKRGCVTVTSAQEDEAMRVICDTALALDNPLYRGDSVVIRDVRCDLNGTTFFYRGTPMRLSLIGRHQTENLRCVLAACEALEDVHGFKLGTDVIRTALDKVRHPARFERLREDPTVILDGAHNPNGLNAFADTVRTLAPEGDRTLIIGMLADKDSRGLDALKGLFTRAIVTNIDNPRALSAERLAERMREICPRVEVAPLPQDAYCRALRCGDAVYICGSLYLASQIRPYILGS